MSSKKLRFEIILPRFYNDGGKVEAEKFLETKKELGKRFNDCSIMPPFTGIWTDLTDGTEYSEKNRGLYVDVLDSEENLRFFKEYKNILKERFQQKEIRITYFYINEV